MSHILNHISNEWDEFEQYHSCPHEPLLQNGSGYTREPRQKAIKPIVLDPQTLSDKKYLTDHSLCNVYCPKRLSFYYEGKYAQT